MTKVDSKAISAIITKIEEAIAELEPILNEQQERYDNFSDEEKESEKGEQLESNVDYLQAAHDRLDDAKASLETILVE